MKFTINKNAIVDVLSKVQGLTGRRSNLAITENVLIKSENSGISITATDLETGFEGFYPADIEKEGVLAVSAKKLYEIVKEYPKQSILINEIENRWIEIGEDKVQYHIVGMNPEDFPDTPYIDEVVFFSIETLALKKIIEKAVIISGAGDEKRAHINGAFLERIHDEKSAILRIVSTDGSRLSTVDYSYKEKSELPAGESILIPKKGLNEVAKFLDMEGTVQIGIKESNFIVKKEKETIIIRLLEGDFPKYENIIVKSESNLIKLDKKEFGRMLKRMTILSSDNYKGAVFTFEENNLMITATNPDIGESKEEMEIQFSGERIEAAFNPKYFIDTLNVIEDEHIIVSIIDSEKPCVIEGDSDKSFISVIMPMRI